MPNTTPISEGNLSEADIILIGEAPAAQEMKAGRPFIGQAGKVLDQLLHSAGIIRREVYITNVFPHPISSGAAYVHPKRGPTAELSEAALELANRLSNTKAKVLVPMGAVALAATTGKTQITKYRGSILEATPAFMGRKVIPTIHPAATLRGQYIWRYFIIQDFKRTRREATFPEIRRPERSLIIAPSHQDATSYLEDILKSASEVGVDIEISNHQVSCISFAKSSASCISIPFKGYNAQPFYSESEEASLWLLIAMIMEAPHITKIGQNLIFDTSVMLQKNNIHTKGPIADTMIAHHIIYPDFPKGLDFLCSTLTDEPYYKDEGKIWDKDFPTDSEWEQFWIYNAKDSAVCMDIWPQLLDEMTNDGYLDQYQRTVAMYEMFNFMTAHGVKVDIERLAETKEKVKADLEGKIIALNELADYPFNALSPKQCQGYFYIHKGIKPYTSRSTGIITTDDKAMQQIYKRYHLDEARLVQEVRGLTKLHGTYLDVGLDADQRLRCSWAPRGTVNGRLSSSQTIFRTGLNFQNLDPRFKGFVVAD